MFLSEMWQRGHLTQNCNARNVLVSESAECRKSYSAFIRFKIGSVDTLARLDSGVQPSVLDLNLVKEHNNPFMRESSFVRGLAANPVQVCVTAEIHLEIGEGQIINQRFWIIISQEPTVILGLEILEMFQVTTFDWHQHRVRLGPRWIPMIAKVREGKIRSNASIIHTLMSDWEIPFSERLDWNIDP